MALHTLPRIAAVCCVALLVLAVCCPAVFATAESSYFHSAPQDDSLTTLKYEFRKNDTLLSTGILQEWNPGVCQAVGSDASVELGTFIGPAESQPGYLDSMVVVYLYLHSSNCSGAFENDGFGSFVHLGSVEDVEGAQPLRAPFSFSGDVPFFGALAGLQVVGTVEVAIPSQPTVQPPVHFTLKYNYSYTSGENYTGMVTEPHVCTAVRDFSLLWLATLRAPAGQPDVLLLSNALWMFDSSSNCTNSGGNRDSVYLVDSSVRRLDSSSSGNSSGDTPVPPAGGVVQGIFLQRPDDELRMVSTYAVQIGEPAPAEPKKPVSHTAAIAVGVTAGVLLGGLALCMLCKKRMPESGGSSEGRHQGSNQAHAHGAQDYIHMA